jgi:hypothetical protein
VERWSSPDALAHCNQTGVVEQVRCAQSKEKKRKETVLLKQADLCVVRVLLSCCGGTQSNLWIPHIIPILPMQVQGWIWYQAESNVACSVR